MPDASPPSSGPGGRDRGTERRDERERHPGRGDERCGQHVDGEVAVGTHERQRGHARCEQQQTDHDRRLDAEPVDHPRGEQDHADHDRRRSSAAARRRLRTRRSPSTCWRYRFRKNHIGIHAAPSRTCATFAAARFGVRKMLRRSNGAGDWPGSPGNRPGAAEATGDRQQRRGGAPADLRCTHDAVDRQRETGGGGERAASRSSRGAPERRASATGVTASDRERDRDVDEEHPRPRAYSVMHAAEEHPSRSAGRGCGAVDRERLRQLLRIASEQHHQQCQRRGAISAAPAP